MAEIPLIQRQRDSFSGGHEGLSMQSAVKCVLQWDGRLVWSH